MIALIYDPVTHTSRRPDGVEVPHVTAILKAVGVTEDFAAVSAISQRVAESVEAAAARGTAVHADCHAWDDDDLDIAAVDPRILPYVHAWAQFRLDKGIEPVVRERQVYHPVFGFTGILDGIFADPYGRRILVDIKTGDPNDAAGHLQTAAYEAAYLAAGDVAPIDERWAVRLAPGLAVPYRVVNYTARPDAYLDFSRFSACLATYHEQPARRRRIA